MLSAPASPPHITTQCALPAMPAMNAADNVMQVATSLIVTQAIPGGRPKVVELTVADCPEEGPAGE
jgi:hypothetical protein